MLILVLSVGIDMAWHLDLSMTRYKVVSHFATPLHENSSEMIDLLCPVSMLVFSSAIIKNMMDPASIGD
jgi:hypothetical protein